MEKEIVPINDGGIHVRGTQKELLLSILVNPLKNAEIHVWVHSHKKINEKSSRMIPTAQCQEYKK